MAKKITKLEMAQINAEVALQEVNFKIDELGGLTSKLYITLTEMEKQFDLIRNVPSESKIKYEKLKQMRLNWKQQAEKIQLDYQKAEMQALGQSAAGVGAGVAVAALGPSAAMGVATTFGVASTGTAISTLSGAAATNAALAWLGGGALAAGGGGMSAGTALLAMAGPAGWAIAGVSLLASGVFFWKTKSDMAVLEDIYTLISNRDVKSHELAVVELSERCRRIVEENSMLEDAIEDIKTFGTNYSTMTIDQKYALGTYINLMESTTALLINPIEGLKPKFTEQDYMTVYDYSTGSFREKVEKYHGAIISLANLLYGIDLDSKEVEVLTKSLRKNEVFLKTVNVEKKDFDKHAIVVTLYILEHMDIIRS